MRFQYISYLWPLLISSSVTVLLCVYAFIRQRHSKCAVSFIVSMLLVTVWSAGNALEMAGADLSTKLFWANVQYFAYCYSPIALLALSMRFTGYARWLRNQKFRWLLLLPSVIIVLVWTDGFFGLMRYNIHLSYSGTFPVIAKNYGPAFYIHAVYEHVINITAIVMLIRAVIYRKTVYRKQASILLIGASLIVFPNLFYITGLSPVKGFDLTPVFFGPAGMLMAWAIFRYKMFDLVPLARATVMETMDTGVMVTDLQGRILDINPAFEKIMGTSVKAASGRETAVIFRDISEFASACAARDTAHIEFSVKTNDGIRIYEAVFSPLADGKGAPIGRLAMVYEITEKKREQQRYLEQQRRLGAAHEKERMARDLHDNLGQVLGFINLQAQGIRQELVTVGVDTVSDKLDRLVEVTQAAHDEIRAYITSARNLLPSDSDFLESLRNDILQFEQRSGIPTEFVTNIDLADIDLAPQIQLHLLSIAKEALNNVQKHSGADRVKITISRKKGILLLYIEDNGRGFTVSDKNDRAGKAFGLSIMRERAVEIGAVLTVESAPGKGCKVALSLPVSQKGENAHETHAGG
ncbi:histidine kinase N-terminal 7TM domain-containing protein [Caproiciproducens faecalis]|uniref:Oxygen sensor histidine kinase NreB n=1 Tax=Caproiciproducens faecalis TaxID=2820301 RepID=A0ABS7DKR8_9FIRM|nr:histidine kinase N-terminal 7TM domain-containing protein [Caproiciproducens faecalis]MBW7571872.1 PAS domain S-box protein [Caproiciproducens faecalis]